MRRSATSALREKLGKQFRQELPLLEETDKPNSRNQRYITLRTV